MLRVSFKTAVKSFSACRFQITRTFFQGLCDSCSYQNQWKFEAVHSHSIPALRRLLSIQRVLHQQHPSESDMMPPEVTANAEVSAHAERIKKWDEQYLALKAFYKEHGHMSVSRSCDKTLSAWIRRQRKAFQMGKLAPDREKKLLELDFRFNAHEAAWMEKYEELKLYKAQHGHTMVPKPCPSNPGLANWVDVQRQNYFSRQKGESHYISDERIALLKAVDFKWNPRDAKWQMMFDDLKEHVRTNKPGQYPSAASREWVRHQRKNYKRYLAGKKVSLTSDRLKKLRSIGIDFDRECQRPFPGCWNSAI